MTLIILIGGAVLLTIVLIVCVADALKKAEK